MLVRVLVLWHLTSLDAPTVAVVWALAIAHSAGVHLKPWMPLLLACGTWTVYVLDRLLDTRGAIRAQNHNILRERHYFHWHHRRTLIPLAAFTAASAAGMIFALMPVAARERNSLIAAAALAYFSGVHAPARVPLWACRILSKEFLVGILFAVGCSALTLPRLHSGFHNWAVVLSVIFLALLAWLNCSAISTWESASGSIDVRAVAFVLALCSFGSAIALVPWFAHTSALLCCGGFSAVLVLALHLRRSRIDPLTLRALADLVLLTPAILLIPGVKYL